MAYHVSPHKTIVRSFTSMDSEAKLSAIKPWLRYFINSDEVHNLLPNEADESMHVKPPEQCLTQQRPSGHAVATAGRCKVSTI